MSLLANTDQAASVRVELDGTQDHLIRYGVDEPVIVGEYALAGAVASVFKGSGGDLTGLFLGNGRRVSDEGGTRVLIEAQSAITVEAIYSGTALALYGDGLYDLKVYGPGVDVDRVTVNNGEAVATKIGDYVYVFGETTLVLDGAPANRAIYLTWNVYGNLPVGASWHIDYSSQTGTAYLPITGIISSTRAYTLTGLTNYVWYTVTLNAMQETVSLVSDTVRVMPTDRFVYLPIVLKQE
jgi:hypothetical protein